MKKILTILSLLLFSQSAFWFDWKQGFKNFEEKKDWFYADCQSQCFIFLSKLWWNDKLKILWNISWDWKFWYSFAVWKKIIQWEIFKIKWWWKIENEFTFSKNKFFSQIPKNSEIVLIFEWKIKIKSLKYKISKNSFWKNISEWRINFWSFDKFAPYTINLLYWPKIWWQSANSIFYWIFILWIFFLIIQWYIKWKEINIFKNIFILSLILWLFYDLRMTTEINKYYINDYKDYISQEKWENIFRDRWYLYSFLDFAKENLKWNIWKFEEISFYTDNSWPFPWTAKYFLYPNKVLKNKKTEKIFLIYWYKKFKINWNILFLDWEKIWKWKIIKYKNLWFIFIKN